jgi:hypothetical protein
MSYQALVGWLEVANLDDYTSEQIGNALLAGLEDSEVFGPDFEAELSELHQLCAEGCVPRDRILALPFRFSLEEFEPDGVRLERELREMAAGLPEASWKTGNYLRLESGVKLAEQGASEALEEAIDDMRETLVLAWNPYLQLPISQSEIVAESVVGHRLLVEGFQGWTHALDFLDAALDGEIPYATALAKVAQANRILVSVQVLARRTEASAAPQEQGLRG